MHYGISGHDVSKHWRFMIEAGKLTLDYVLFHLNIFFSQFYVIESHDFYAGDAIIHHILLPCFGTHIIKATHCLSHPDPECKETGIMCELIAQRSMHGTAVLYTR